MINLLNKKENNICVVGLGYVGLPVALEFAKKYKVVGFDINQHRVELMQKGIDPSNELEPSEFDDCDITFTSKPEQIKDCTFYIVAVPTPINEHKYPDLKPLIGACKIVGGILKKGDIVVFESTVYPGCTEEDCVPVLEKESGLKFGDGFTVGYSPERINPGDKVHTLTRITKVVSGSDETTLKIVSNVYNSIIEAGVHEASSIKVAEASKIIENTQRDLNIALMNELSLIFKKMGINTFEVLEAAGTKWNFLPFRPGLVGGHCIGVDPYYLTYKADMLGYHPQVILAGRRINDGMGEYIASQTVKQMIENGTPIKGSKVHVLGLTFKENVPDLRNSKVIDVITELQSFGIDVYVHDPLAEPDEAMEHYGVQLSSWEELPVANAIVMAVAHQEYLDKPLSEYVLKVEKGSCFVDVKSQFDQDLLKDAGLKVWRL